MRWHHHFCLAGTLLLPFPWLSAIGGALVGIGATWWFFGRYYDYDIKEWIKESRL